MKRVKSLISPLCADPDSIFKTVEFLIKLLITYIVFMLSDNGTSMEYWMKHGRFLPVNRSSLEAAALPLQLSAEEPVATGRKKLKLTDQQSSSKRH